MEESWIAEEAPLDDRQELAIECDGLGQGLLIPQPAGEEEGDRGPG